jgi:BirA family biotin operon repressor/biotin-[acetyl-CoA-carboxylase] ligase
MNETKLQTLTKNHIIDRLIYREEVTSTNTVAKEQIGTNEFASTLVIAEIQTAGKGRMGRSWSSPYGTGIWMSLLLKPVQDSAVLSRITLISALAIANGIRDISGLEAQIKWPNDVILGSRKVCGILTEMVSDGRNNYVIPGIGINVNTREFPPELGKKATSVYLETGRECSREDLVVSVITHFMKAYHQFEQQGDLSFLLEDYNRLLINRGREVLLTDANGSFPDNPYTALRINAEGSLIVADRNGTLHEVSCGEVSVRGLLGYV